MRRVSCEGIERKDKVRVVLYEHVHTRPVVQYTFFLTQLCYYPVVIYVIYSSLCFHK